MRCAIHKGIGRPFGIEEVYRHLIRHGRSPDSRSWRGPSEPDSSDDEWEEDYTARMTGKNQRPQIHDSGVLVRNLMQDIFQEVQAFTAAEENIENITMSALESMDKITGLNDKGGTDNANLGGASNLNRDEENDNNQGDQTKNPNTCGKPDFLLERAAKAASQHGSTCQVQKQASVEEERIKDAKALEEDAVCILYPR